MKYESWTVGNIIDIWKKHQLFVDREYQRGVVWKPEQKKKLIDSILRKFPIPLLILQKDGCNFNIIDGQQRIEAIIGFYENKLKYLSNDAWSNFKLLEAAHFPLYLSEPSSWMNSKYHELEDEDKLNFLSYTIQVIILEDYSNNEIRDIFVRLQSGSPLNFQEKMDSLPGEFNHFILEIAGKELVLEKNLIQSTGNDIDFSGHEFFTHYVQNTSTDRGKIRKLCADIYLLFRELFSENVITGISQHKNESFYLDKLDFSIENPINEYFVELITELSKIEELHFENKKDKLKNWESLHIILFSGICKIIELENWHDRIGNAFINFRRTLKSNINESEIKEFQDLTMTDANSGKTIKRRMEIFTKIMLKNMYGLTNYYSLMGKENCKINYGKKTEFLNPINANSNLPLDLVNKIMIDIVFLPANNKNEEEEGKNGSPTYRVTNISAHFKNGQISEYSSPQKLYIDVFPETESVSLNRAGLIFGTRDSTPRIDETFWKFIDMLDFKMNDTMYSLKRSDFDEFWGDRYK